MCIVFTNCKAQDGSTATYSVKAIPDIARFEKMTEREIRIDTMMDRHNRESLQQMVDGTAFKEGVSEADKQQAIEHQKIISQRYKDNRSRYFLDLYINDKKDAIHLAGDTLTSDCNCYLNGDTIKIKMGIWAFGGFAFSIHLTQNDFTSKYWEDTHERPIYKAALSDSVLVDNVLVENGEQALILDTKPTFKINQNITGYLTFKTKNYYRTSDHESGMAKDFYNAKSMDKLNMAGSLYFKCTIRKKDHW